MNSIILEAISRDKKKQKVNVLRREGMIPAVLYGHNIASQVLAVNVKVFEKAHKQAGASTLVDLKIDGKDPVKVIIQDVAPHHITLKPWHVDFYQVSMTEKLKAKIVLKFVGESPAVKELSGILLKNVQEVEVECLPGDLISEIEIDLSGLKTFDDSIKIKDIPVLPGITILNNPEDSVVFVQPPRVEEEVSVPSETEQIGKIEKVGEKKEEGEEEAATEEKGKEKGKEKEKEKKNEK